MPFKFEFLLILDFSEFLLDDLSSKQNLNKNIIYFII